jgi:hypothetical protein
MTRHPLGKPLSNFLSVEGTGSSGSSADDWGNTGAATVREVTGNLGIFIRRTPGIVQFGGEIKVAQAE